MIRPELRRAFWRWREVLIGIAVIVAGAWMISLGGLLLQALGAIAGLIGMALAFVALRRVRFRQGMGGVGYVEVMEGQVSYLAPDSGGFAALSELSQVVLACTPSGRVWRLFQLGGPEVVIPVEAAGADQLFDVFVALPGAEPSRILSALDQRVPHDPITVWRKGPRVALT